MISHFFKKISYRPLKMVRYINFSNRAELEQYIAEKLEKSLKYLEEIQKPDSTEEGQEELIQSIARTNYLTKYILTNFLKSIHDSNHQIREDPNFKVFLLLTKNRKFMKWKINISKKLL